MTPSKWSLSYTHATGIMNIWGGISKVLRVLFLFFVDTLLGNFKMLVISSISYTVGLSLLAMSMLLALANATGTCKQYKPECIGPTQNVLFYIGMALIAIGMAGNLLSVEPLREAQEDSPTIGYFGKTSLGMVAFVTITGFFAFPYIRQWLLLFGVPGIILVSVALRFLCGWNKYKKSGPEGSPVSDVCRVLVAAALKISQPFPPDTNHLYKEDDEDHKSFPPSRFLRYLLSDADRTLSTYIFWSCFKCLEKAAIILPDQSLEDQVRNRWKLCSIEQIEAAKFVLRVIPIGATFIVCTIVSSVYKGCTLGT
ncbi:hypothetical protein ACS0TY_015794 [Phlomoides rotata]